MFENSKWINYSLKKDPSVKNSLPSPYIAKTFSLKEKPSKAILNICGYGEGAYYINGSLIPSGRRFRRLFQRQLYIILMTLPKCLKMVKTE